MTDLDEVVDCSNVWEYEFEIDSDVVPVTCADAENPPNLNPAPTYFSTVCPQDVLVLVVVLVEWVTEIVSVTSVGTPIEETGTHEAFAIVTFGTHGGGGGGAFK